MEHGGWLGTPTSDFAAHLPLMVSDDSSVFKLTSTASSKH